MDSQGAAKASASIFPGATISGRFRVERLLGRGAMGSVWLARHLALDVDVAVKFIDGAFRNETGHRSRFVLEAQSAARIHSPHVVNILDFGEDDGRLYIAMELLSGEDLGALIDRCKRLSVDVTARIVTHACRGLAKAHALGIAHRDIKPENLFLCGDGDDEGFVLKILDFGVAKSDHKAASLTKTTAGALIGSPAFMSPEQARGLSNIDGRSDLFSLAVVAYYCLTGVPPFRGDSLTELLFEVIGADPVPVTKLVSGLPRGLDAWFERALQKDPARRFASAKEMSHAFQVAIGRDATSGVDSSGLDHSSAKIRAAQNQARTIVSDDPIHDPVLEVSSYAPPPPAPSAPRVVTSSNVTASGSVATALSQLGELPGVLGAALVGPGGTTLAHYSATGFIAASFGEVVEKIVAALESFENLDTTRPQALALHFEGASVLLRWIEGYVLTVLGTEHLNSTVLTVNLNAAASKLANMAAQGGGAAIVFRATLSEKTHDPLFDASSSGAQFRSPYGTPNPYATPAGAPAPHDPVPDAVLTQLTQLYAKPLGAVGRLSILQRLKNTRPSFASFEDFVRSLASGIDDPTLRQAFLVAALDLIPPALRDQTSTSSGGIASSPGASAPGTLANAPNPVESVPSSVASPSTSSNAAAPTTSTPPQRSAAPAPPKLKRTIVYRGRKIRGDD
jgi:serine/threonine protein kinase